MSSTAVYEKAWLRNLNGAQKYVARQRNREGLRDMQQLMRQFLRLYR